MKDVRYSHTASLLSNGKVLVTGGGITDVFASMGTELYDPSIGKWKSEGDMQNNRVMHTASVLANGNVLIAAGGNSQYVQYQLNTAELYNSTAETFTFSDNFNN